MQAEDEGDEGDGDSSPQEELGVGDAVSTVREEEEEGSDNLSFLSNESMSSAKFNKIVINDEDHFASTPPVHIVIIQAGALASERERERGPWETNTSNFCVQGGFPVRKSST